MQETKEVKLPSGKIAVIKTYTTRGDDRVANEILNEGVTVTKTEQGEPSIEFSLRAMTESQAKYVERLVVSIDGAPVNASMLDQLPSQDYNALDAAVAEVTKVDPKSSPKG